MALQLDPLGNGCQLRDLRKRLLAEMGGDVLGQRLRAVGTLNMCPVAFRIGE